MGVPKFYRWISERYPKINQVITDTALLPEFDHLYLDMNGILHGCSHPNDKDVSDKISEKDMIFAIMSYMDRIITQIVKPKVSVFMAIDGVAPRAKLNQQRSRRFRSAKDLLEATAAASATNLESSTTQEGYGGAFDSNCITPGTDFMARISDAIKYFIRKKIQEDPFWRNLQVVFSGHEVPGEGEHKIMDFIREMKSSPNYQPNTRHVMYGQDADLIMLGLVTHEPHFTLLREIIDFNFNNNDSSKNSLKAVKKFTKQSDFQLLHLSILREYLAYEFASSSNNDEEDNYDLERIIDDFVFLTFLVGNDFLPHLQSLDIADGAFDLLFDTYRKQRSTWGKDQYLVDTGTFSDPHRLEAFLQEIGQTEHAILEKREEQEVTYRKKKRNWDKRDSKPASLPSEAEIFKEEQSKQTEYLSMLSKMSSTSSSSSATNGNNKSNNDGSNKDFKGRYYYEKLGLTPADVNEHFALRKAYIEGLAWCLAYYYRGCISWGWFFPYHYGPMLSDLQNLPTIFADINFELGEPLKPFQQLMGCLPPASCALVPAPYRKLMTSPISPIRLFYPTDFKIDMEGKKNPWEGINLLEFIDVQLLKDTIREHCPDTLLTADERARNSLGKVFLFTYDETVRDTIPSFNRGIGFPDISVCKSRVTCLEQNNRIDIPFQPRLVPGTIIPAPGYPSLKVLPIASVDRSPIGLNCFGMVSKYPNFVLNLHEMPPDLPSAEQLADKVLGKHLFINYPMMHEAKVVAISDVNCEVRLVSNNKKKLVKYSEEQSSQWMFETNTLQEQYLRGVGIPGTGGLGIGKIRIRLFLKPLQGMKISLTDGSSKKVFGNEEADIPIQTALWHSPAPDPRFIERGPMQVKDLYPSGCQVVLTKGKYKGCIGKVTGFTSDDNAENNNTKLITKVRIVPPEPPFGLAIARSVRESYLSSTEAAEVLKLNPQVLGKIMGSLLVEPGRYDLGLNVRYKKEFFVIGYTRFIQKRGSNNNTHKKSANAWQPGDSVRVFGSHMEPATEQENDGDGFWEYTAQAVRLVAVYRTKFPQLFTALTKYPHEKKYDAFQLFGSKGKEMLPKVREWLNILETATFPRTPVTTNAMSLPAISAIQRAADVRAASLEQAGPLKEVNLKLPPSVLFREGSKSATDVLQPATGGDGMSEPQLGDRIVNLCANGVSFGARGTVVSVHSSTHGCVEVVMDDEFIGGSNLQGSCHNFRGKLCLWAHLLKISASDSVDDTKEYITNIPAATAAADVKTFLNKVEYPKVVPSADVKNASQTSENRVAVYLTPSKNMKADRSKTPTDGSKKKQGVWKEAKGPQAGSGKGFKVLRNSRVKSGYMAWKNHMKKNASLNAPMSNRASSTAVNPPQSTTSARTASLKAVPGVTASSSGEAAFVEYNAAPVRTPATAADALLALMIDDASVKPAPAAAQVAMQQGSTPKFNFTYTQHDGVSSVSSSKEQVVTHNNKFGSYQTRPMNPSMQPYYPSSSQVPSSGFMGGYHSMMVPPRQIPVYDQMSSKSVIIPRTKKTVAVPTKKNTEHNGMFQASDGGSTIIPSVVVSKAEK